jgi:peptidoglycan/LPS O-acetylase OafA/YrhL
VGETRKSDTLISGSRACTPPYDLVMKRAERPHALAADRGDASSVASRNRIVAMDGLRGLAILAVLLYHGTPAAPHAKGWVLRPVGQILQMGWLGVDLFFVLSGFLITRMLLETTGDPNYFRSFYLRRALRILPVYYGLLLALALLTVPLQIQWHGTAVDFLFYIQNFISYDRLTLAFRFGHIHLEHLWSLAVEEQFYLVWPLVAWLLRRRGSFVAIPFALIVACPVGRCLWFHSGEPLGGAYLWTPFRMDTLAWGALAAWIVRLRPQQVRVTGAALTASGLAAMIGVVIATIPRPDLFELTFTRFGYSATASAFCGLVLYAFAPGPAVERVFGNRVLRWLGKYSYGIYVYHYLFATAFFRVQHRAAEVSGSKVLGEVAYLLSMSLFGITAAYVSYQLYEKWWLLLKDRIARYSTQNEARPEYATDAAPIVA